SPSFLACSFFKKYGTVAIKKSCIGIISASNVAIKGEFVCCIATYNESVDLVRKTVNGCIHMQYPDKKKVHIYICDDGNREEM
ncbi:hypothetical protein EWM17_19755, partial [Clostridioides difficile]